MKLAHRLYTDFQYFFECLQFDEDKPAQRRPPLPEGPDTEYIAMPSFMISSSDNSCSIVCMISISEMKLLNFWIFTPLAVIHAGLTFGFN